MYWSSFTLLAYQVFDILIACQSMNLYSIFLLKICKIHVWKYLCFQVKKEPVAVALKDTREEVEDEVVDDFAVEKDIVEEEAEAAVIFQYLL